jgi:hypothetical protein
MRATTALNTFRIGARAVLFTAAVAGLLAAIVRYAVIPPYLDVVGFIPFDAQPRLSHIMVGIELSAFRRGVPADVYLLFAIVDFLSAAATACAFTIGWIWLFARVPNRIFAFLKRGGILLLPSYVLLLDAIMKVAFYRLVGGIDSGAYAAGIEFAVMVHRLGSALTDVRNYLTAAFVIAAVTGLILRRAR